jgi:Fic family protein
MYKPNFCYKNKIIRNLTSIAEARVIIINSPLIPKWQVFLRRDALIQSAHSSTAIEGNPLTLEEVSELAAGREIMVNRKDRQEVLNYIEALEKMPEFAEKKPFASSDLLKIHGIVSRNTLENPADEGVFRNRQVVVGNRRTGRIVYTPPLADQVPRLVKIFLEWFLSPTALELDPVIHAGISHYEIARIHPFIDGNGRTARVLASLILYIRGFDLNRYFTLDDYYDNDRRAYYDALKTVDAETQDLSQWLEYFTEGVAVSIDAVKKKVIGLSKDIKVLKQKGQIALTDRQMKIVEWLVENGSITNRKIREIFNLSNRMALNEIEELIRINIISKTGQGRSVRYELI